MYGAQTIERAPGHWVLARAGKRVLRPGGVELTQRMLAGLDIRAGDSIVELAPGVGHTAERVIARSPMSYIGVDREPDVIDQLARRLGRDGVRFVQGDAQDTGLPGETATVLFGEAMLSMQPMPQKKRIVAEAWRLLRNGGRYGIHELCLTDAGAADEGRRKVEAGLSMAIHHGVCLLTSREWRELMEAAGFQVRAEIRSPMRLLEPGRIVRDEGITGALRFAFNVLRNAQARRRVLSMRKAFHHFGDQLQAISLTCEKRYETQ